jgi:hypothetical protein
VWLRAHPRTRIGRRTAEAFFSEKNNSDALRRLGVLLDAAQSTMYQFIKL